MVLWPVENILLDVIEAALKTTLSMILYEAMYIPDTGVWGKRERVRMRMRARARARAREAVPR